MVLFVTVVSHTRLEPSILSASLVTTVSDVDFLLFRVLEMVSDTQVLVDITNEFFK